MGTTTTITVKGEIDIASVSLIAGPLKTVLAEKPETIVLDLQQTEFIETSGIGALFRFEQSADLASVRFVVITGREVQRLIELCDFDGHFRVPPSRTVEVGDLGTAA